MKTLIVGGDFGLVPKASKILDELAYSITGPKVVHNGGNLFELEALAEAAKNYSVIIWMPNIINSVAKIYPKKSTGAILIISKAIKGQQTIGDAVSRIFKLHANAVIAITSARLLKENQPDDIRYTFQLLDALGNSWASTQQIQRISIAINDLVQWTGQSTRQATVFSPEIMQHKENIVDLTPFFSAVHKVAAKVENERGGRYFGNASTRCEFTFPTAKLDDNLILVSGRSTPKDKLSIDDMIYTKLNQQDTLYYGIQDTKPSVDTPIQLQLYAKYPLVRYMIHGHAYIQGAPMTEKYFPCGDLRELDQLTKVIDAALFYPNFVVNIKNHGFLIGTSTIAAMQSIVDRAQINYRELGEIIDG